MGERPEDEVMERQQGVPVETTQQSPWVEPGPLFEVRAGRRRRDPPFEPRFTGQLHLRAQAEQPVGLERFDAPEVERVTHPQLVRVAAAAPHPDATDGAVEGAPQAPQ